MFWTLLATAPSISYQTQRSTIRCQRTRKLSLMQDLVSSNPWALVSGEPSEFGEGYVDLSEEFPGIQNVTDTVDAAGDLIESGALSSTTSNGVATTTITETLFTEWQQQNSGRMQRWGAAGGSEDTIYDGSENILSDLVLLGGATVSVGDNDDVNLTIADSGAISVPVTTDASPTFIDVAMNAVTGALQSLKSTLIPEWFNRLSGWRLPP